MGDFDRLMQLHAEIAGSGPGRKYNVAVLHKSAILLLFASWESYCEDAVSELHERVTAQVGSPREMPTAMKQYILRSITDNTKNELAFWELLGDAWRSKLKKVLRNTEEQRNRSFNTPRAGIVDKHFEESLGIKNLSSTWHWQGMNKDQAAKKLSAFIELRGSIAHRLGEARVIHRNTVVGYGAFVRQLVSLTDGFLVARYNSRGFVRREVRANSASVSVE